MSQAFFRNCFLLFFLFRCGWIWLDDINLVFPKRICYLGGYVPPIINTGCVFSQYGSSSYLLSLLLCRPVNRASISISINGSVQVCHMTIGRLSCRKREKDKKEKKGQNRRLKGKE